MENNVTTSERLSVFPFPSSCTTVGNPGNGLAMPALAMAYVPTQAWEGVYDPSVALPRGTLFESLDKPFLGEEVPK